MIAACLGHPETLEEQRARFRPEAKKSWALVSQSTEPETALDAFV
jgi:hypothetical protein